LNKIKPILTIKKIGILRFNFGVLLGIGYGFLVNLWFRLLDYGFFVVFDLTKHNNLALDGFLISPYNSFLLALTSSSLGFCFTMYFWTSKPFSYNRKINFRNRLAQTNSIFIFMLILFVFTKYLTFSTSFRYDGFGVDLNENYSYLPFFLPIFIFLFNWATVSQIFKSGKFILFSTILVFTYGILLSSNSRAHIWVTGFSIEEIMEKIDQRDKHSELISKKILGKWTEELWLGVENSNLPPPSARISDYDSIWPPYYEISKNQIKHFFLGIDSTSYTLQKRDNVMILNSLRTYLIGYQKEWRILSISDTIMLIERGYNKYDRNWIDGIDTLKLMKKR
tara:strand:+ start:1108 stop:2118 length:1011 start_codon:yes stop_codon:yes gene_type:complete